MPHGNLIDLSGQIFGRLTVLKIDNSIAQKPIYWKCRCSCGNIATIRGSRLTSGITQSCGCLANERTIARSTIHGMSHVSEYKIRMGMIARCYNPSSPNFKNYGGRGITVCDEWKNDFITFFKYVGKRPSPKHSLDRIDNDGNYEPGNVRWATQKQQSNNARHNHKITIHEWTMNLCQWARFVGKKESAISERLKKGWPPAKAIFYPIKHYNHN
jgi:hypothetical protein